LQAAPSTALLAPRVRFARPGRIGYLSCGVGNAKLAFAAWRRGVRVKNPPLPEAQFEGEHIMKVSI
jgi:hypothetical protein